MSNADVFGSIPMPSVMMANRRMRMAGLIARHDDLLAKKILFLDTQHWHIDMLKKDTSL